MSACKYCGCTAWLLTVSPNGLCDACDHLVTMDIRQRADMIEDSVQAAERTLNPHSKIAKLDSVVENLSVLEKYEKRGIPTIKGSAAERLKKSLSERDSLLLKTAQAELDEVLKKVRGVTDPEAKIKLYSGLELKLQEYRTRLGEHKQLEKLHRKVSQASGRIRLNSEIEAARRAEESGRIAEAKQFYLKAMNRLKSSSIDASLSLSMRVKVEERLKSLT